jgi:hypothetical protein
MAWDVLSKSRTDGVDEEYSGDTPMDAFGGALRKIAAECTDRTGRTPSVAELVDAVTAAIEGAPAGSVLDPATASARLAGWREAIASAKAAPKRQRPKQGDVLAIPYAGDGKTEIYGWLLFAPKKDLPSPGLGVCLVVLDRDVRGGERSEGGEVADDLAEVVRAPLLLGPLHPNDREIREGEWRIVGNVSGDFDAMLPTFAVQARRGNEWVHVVRDYAGNDVEDTPANRARVREQAVGGAGHLPLAIRALRGMGRWLDGFDSWRARGVKRP